MSMRLKVGDSKSKLYLFEVRKQDHEVVHRTGIDVSQQSPQFVRSIIKSEYNYQGLDILHLGAPAHTWDGLYKGLIQHILYPKLYVKTYGKKAYNQDQLMGPFNIERSDHIENLIAELITLHSSSKKVLAKFIIDTYREDGRESGYFAEFETWLLEHA